MLSKNEMQDYWDSRFLREGYIWSEKPSESAKYANRLFNKFAIIESDLIDEPEQHGKEGKHIHKCRYILALNTSCYPPSD